jgi:hypothetical protein
LGGGYFVGGGNVANANSSGNETSIKQLFQRMIPDGDEIMEGTVIQPSPLKIQMTNDEKLIINERITIVPWHLTDYTTTADILKDEGTLDSQTLQDGGHGGHMGGDGTHINHLDTFNLHKGTINVYNALKKGEKVHVLSLNHGKLYYVLDRVTGQVVQ